MENALQDKEENSIEYASAPSTFPEKGISRNDRAVERLRK